MIAIAYHDAVAADWSTAFSPLRQLSQFRCFHDTAVGGPFMSNDPFARFESSRGGWLIPVVLFVVGAMGTMVGIRAIHGLEVPSIQQAPAQGDLPPSESATLETPDANAPDAGVPNAETPNAETSDTGVPGLNSIDRQ